MHYDIAIVGGGLVGASLATALKDSSYRIALIDAKKPTHNDARLFGLNHASCQFLNKMGIWSLLAPHAVPIHKVHVSHQGHFGAVRLKREDMALDELGYVIPAYIIEKALHEQLETQANVTLYQPAKLKELTQDSEVHLTIETETVEKNISAAILIGADGAHSTVRELAGIRADTIDYQQSAIVTRTTLQKNHEHIAYERFVKDGAIAMLPLSNNECATIWSADNTVINELKALSDMEFMQRLQKEFGYRLGRFQKIGQRSHYPLYRVKAETMTRDHVFLLGNAAHSLHPIAAQGFNLALYETALLVDGLLKKQPLAEIAALTEKQRAISIGVSHRLPSLFATDSLFKQFFLQCGMVAFDLAAPLKRTLMKSLILGSH